eukprot:2468820-Rhodomonas_salina.1
MCGGARGAGELGDVRDCWATIEHVDGRGSRTGSGTGLLNQGTTGQGSMRRRTAWGRGGC